MDVALLLTAGLMGVAGTPHCAAMCGAPCAAALGGRRDAASIVAWQVARLVSYAAAGAVVAIGVGAIAGLGRTAEAFRPVWALLHVGALALGLWLVVVGRQPAVLRHLGLRPAAQPGGVAVVSGPVPGRRATGLPRAAGAGLLWGLWPCGLLQSALVVAALADGAAGGAGVMAVFAAGSALGPLAGPALWSRFGGGVATPAWAVRAAGLLLAGASGWALSHGLWERVAAWCA